MHRGVLERMELETKTLLRPWTVEFEISCSGVAIAQQRQAIKGIQNSSGRFEVRLAFRSEHLKAHLISFIYACCKVIFSSIVVASRSWFLLSI